ncbi:universal stress protein [Paeniglutamicibacter gangotriensis]|uniref:Universal stress protein family protein n=1 Tax=Paeniglutamicibacter gangotriensis Lz1y TaxID=1276920 RepID=M7N6C0_9MICC|nr:universal stress protein [Paeniglutamicibacter gangotriensis]EMQ97294.1 Universal stress protein family protein [Paeniglutamicibacter gangotriensis Lz1y]
MRYVVGCTEDKRGREAISLALALSRSLAEPTNAELELVHIIPGVPPAEAATRNERVYQEFLQQGAQKWMDRALALVPSSMSARTHIRFAASMAEGLLEAVAVFRANLVVVGAASSGPLRRFTVGSVANALLHSSPVPVALAPSGYLPPREITRITCALGTRAGADSVLEAAVDAAAVRHVPLRLVSLVAMDGEKYRGDRIDAARVHARKTLETAIAGVRNRTIVTADVAQGRSTEAAVEALDWDESEIVLLGSSRLAERSRIFLGSTANKMLRALPVPIVVVPRFYVLVPADAHHGYI